MTAPTPSPEEFAKRVFPTKIRVGQCAIDCATVEEADEMQSRLNAAAAALTAPLREEVERWQVRCLTAEMDRDVADAKLAGDWPNELVERERARAERAEAEVARLRAALQPFAEFERLLLPGDDERMVAGRRDPAQSRHGRMVKVTVGDFRAAAKALAPEGGPGKEAPREA